MPAMPPMPPIWPKSPRGGGIVWKVGQIGGIGGIAGIGTSLVKYTYYSSSSITGFFTIFKKYFPLGNLFQK